GAVVGDQQAVMFAHVLGVADPVVEVLRDFGIAFLFDFGGAVLDGFLEERDGLGLGGVLAGGRIVAAVADFGFRALIEEIVVGAGDVEKDFLEGADVLVELVGVFVLGPILRHGEEAAPDVVPVEEDGFGRRADLLGLRGVLRVSAHDGHGGGK